MSNEKVFQMKLQKVYPLLVAKAEKKGRTREEVDRVTAWLTGYTPEELARLEGERCPSMDRAADAFAALLAGASEEEPDPVRRRVLRQAAVPPGSLDLSGGRGGRFEKRREIRQL